MLFFERLCGVTEKYLGLASQEHITDRPVTELYIELRDTSKDNIKLLSEIIKKFSEEGGKFIRFLCLPLVDSAVVDLMAYSRVLGLITFFETSLSRLHITDIGGLTNNVVLHVVPPESKLSLDAPDMCREFNHVKDYTTKFKGNVGVICHVTPKNLDSITKSYDILTDTYKVKLVWLMFHEGVTTRKANEVLDSIITMESIFAARNKASIDALNGYKKYLSAEKPTFESCMLSKDSITITHDMKILPCYNYLFGSGGDFDDYITYNPALTLRAQVSERMPHMCAKCCTYYEASMNNPDVIQEFKNL